MSSLPFQLVCAMSRCRTILRFNGLFSASTGYPSVILYLFQKRTVNDKRHKLNGSTSCHPRNKVDVEHMIYRPTFGQKCVLRVTKQEHQNNLIEKWIKFISWFFYIINSTWEKHYTFFFSFLVCNYYCYRCWCYYAKKNRLEDRDAMNLNSWTIF